MRELALHILDIAENSINAGASLIQISVTEDDRQDKLSLSVIDNGRGMDADRVKAVIDPFVTSRTTRKVGLGIPLLKAAAESCNGTFSLCSKELQGTSLSCQFQRSHIDRMPLGDLPGTLLTLLIGYPPVHWVFSYQFNDQKYEFDDVLIKSELDGVPLSEPAVLTYLRRTLEEGMGEIRQEASIFHSSLH